MPPDNNQDYQKIIQELKARKFQPVYLLHGEEPYFIDEISNFIEEHALTEMEKAFNQTILYLEAYQTREEAEKVLQNINTLTKFPNIGLKTNKIFTKSIGFQVFGSSIEDIDYQITKVYLYLLDNGWNGRRFKIGLFLSAQSEVNNKY